ncbi:MAG: polysaccharide deacetylase family protein [Elusimicrobiota bacterium]
MINLVDFSLNKLKLFMIRNLSIFSFLIFICSFISAQYSPQIALTFDDGPRPASTYRLRKVLNRYSIPGTFFIVGRVADLNPQEIMNLHNEGHEVANHSWNHSDFKILRMNSILWELNNTRTLIHRLTGEKTPYFRPPGLSEKYLKKKFIVPHGYKIVLWDLHSLDQEGHSSEEIAERILSQVKDGDVILMHNGIIPTVEALDCIIPELKSRGFEFVTISKLLESKNRRWFMVER